MRENLQSMAESVPQSTDHWQETKP